MYQTKTDRNLSSGANLGPWSCEVQHFLNYSYMKITPLHKAQIDKISV